MKASIYVRVSTEEQAVAGISLELQEAECRRRAVIEGASEIRVYQDEGRSGMDWGRPGLQALLADLPDTDLLVVWTKDRLARDLRLLLDVVTALSKNGVQLIVLREHVTTETADGILTLQVSGAVGEFHARRTSENVRAAVQRIAESGRKPGGYAYGYVRKDKALVVMPEEAKVVRDIYKRLAGGEGLLSIARDLNARDVPRKRGGRLWTVKHIRDIASNPVYIGKFNWRGEVLDGNHEPIIKPRQWAQVQELLGLRRRNHGQRSAHFGALFTCGLCGGRMGGTNTYKQNPKGPRRMYPVLRCCQRELDPTIHEPIQVVETKAVAVVWRHTELLLEGTHIEDAIAGAMAAIDTGKDRRQEIRARLKEIGDQLLRTAQLAQRGALPLDVLVEANAPLVQEREQLEAELSASRTPPAVEAWRGLLRKDIPAVIASLREEGSVEQQLAFLLKLYDRVEVHKRELVLYYAGGLLEPERRPLPKRYMGKGVGF